MARGTIKTDELDKLIIDEDTARTLVEWIGGPTKISLRNPPITEGLVEFVDKTVALMPKNTMYFKADEDHITMILVTDGKNSILWLVEYDVSPEGLFHVRIPPAMKAKIGPSTEALVSNITGFWAVSMMYMRDYQGTTVTAATITNERIAKNKKPKGGKGKKRVVYINRKVYTIQLPPANQPPRNFERHVEAWNVRGHKRRYKKTGKEIFIKPHTRGIGTITPKEYRVREEKE